MKKNIKISFWIILISVLFSCTDMLKEEPLSSLTNENTYQTVTDAETGVIGVYAGMNQGVAWVRHIPMYGWGDGGTDMLGFTSTAATYAFSNYSITAVDTYLKQHWASCYNVINRANAVLAEVGGIEADEETINSYKAEVTFIRAYVYMDLVRFYGAVPLRLTPTETIESALASPRVAESEIWAQIVTDLEYAEEYLPETNVAGRATKWAAKGLLAKAYLTMGGYPNGNYEKPEWFEKAAQKSYEVISQSGIGLIPTTPGDPGAFREYGDQFLASGENSAESIFEIQFQGPDFGSGWGYLGVTGNKAFDYTDYGSYYNFYGTGRVGSDFVLSFNDDDIRFQWSVGPFYYNATLARSARPLNNWNPYKRRVEGIPASDSKNDLNHIVLRMADIYLLYAEASNEATGDPNDRRYGLSAYDAINVVRQRAQVTLMDDNYLMKDSPYSSNDLLYDMSFESFDKTNPNYDGRHVYYSGTLKERFRDAVLMERAWELCFEGHRWFDLKRTGKLVEFAKNTSSLAKGRLAKFTDPIDKSNWSQLPSDKTTYKWGATAIHEYNQLLPIPVTEILMNTGMDEGDQNPGY